MDQIEEWKEEDLNENEEDENNLNEDDDDDEDDEDYEPEEEEDDDDEDDDSGFIEEDDEEEEDEKEDYEFEEGKNYVERYVYKNGEERYGYPYYGPDNAFWAKIPLRNFENDINRPRILRFGHYLVIKIDEHDSNETGKPKGPKPVVFLAVDMRDDSVQEITTYDESWLFEHSFKEGWDAKYSLTKYNENQMIRFGKAKSDKTLTLVTIESFQPFQLKFEDIVAENSPLVSYHTAHVHNDFLYVYGGVIPKVEGKQTCLWRFDIKNRTWELLNPSGEAPGSFSGMSFVFEDHFYLFGGDSFDHHFVLNFETMTWKKFRRRIDLGEAEVDQCLYKGHVMILDEYIVYCDGNGNPMNYDECREANSYHEVRFWEIDLNATPKKEETVRSQKISLDYWLKHTPVMYDNYMLNFGVRYTSDEFAEFCMFALDLNFLELPLPESEEEKRFKALFLNQENSDITFKVQDKQIPAHKEVLIKKSKYFASALENTIESVIEIQDCDESTFKEFLRYLYCEGFHAKEGIPKEVTFKLIALAHKYMQYDLRDECTEILKFNLNPGNVFDALDLACQLKLTRLKNSCIDALKNKINIQNISRTVQFLENQDSPKLKLIAIRFILKNFEKISFENLTLFEDFLVKNFGIDTMTLFVKAAYSKRTYSGKWISELSKDGTTDLRSVLVNFGSKNLQEMKSKEIFKDLPKMFLVDLVSHGLFNKEKEGSN